MVDSTLETIHYENQDRQVSWKGIGINEGIEFKSFMTGDVASRLNDEEGLTEFETHLRGLTSTGFATDNLNEVLSAEIPEERDWAIGEAMAEAYLTRNYGVTWPWNMERDKRSPRASLPGADLIGFEKNGTTIRLLLGEVKTSGDPNTPPGVMNGRSGMRHQIDALANNLGLIFQLFKWLFHRCKGNEYEYFFNISISQYFNSDKKDISLYGILIRDTNPNELDLKARGQTLSGNLKSPTTCRLISIYLPCKIADLPSRVSGGKS